MSKDFITSPLYNATLSGNMEKFNEELGKVLREQELPHDLSKIVSEIARKDNGAMLTTLLRIANTINKLRAGDNSLEKGLATGEVEMRAVTDLDSNDLHIKEGKAHTNLDMRIVVNYAGIGDATRNPIKPNMMFAAVKSPQFADAIKAGDIMVSNALANIVSRPGPQARRLEPILEAIDASAPDKMADIARAAFVNSVQGSISNDPNCFNSGSRESFDLVAARLDQEGVDAVAMALSRQLEGHNAEFLDRQKSIIERTSDDVLKKLHKTMTATGTAEILDLLNERIGSEIDPKETLLSAVGSELGSGGTQQAKERSLDNLKKLLDSNTFDEDTIFEAMHAAIKAKKDEHLSQLIDYAQDKGMSDVANRETDDHSSLLIKALMVKNGKSYDKTENPLVERMAAMLLRLNTAVRPDAKGNQPLSILAERGMEHTGTYRVIGRALDKEVDVTYAGREAVAAFKAITQAKLDVLKQLQGMNITDPNVIALMLGGTPAAPVQQQPEPPPRALGSHTSRIVEREQDRGKGEGASPAD